MKKYQLIALLLFSINCIAQTFTEYKGEDFSIQFPETWKIVPKEKSPLALVVFRQPEKSSERHGVTFNVNIFATPGYNLNKSYSGLLNSLNESKNFELLENGTTTIADQNFKWFIESHSNNLDPKQKMHNLVFVTYKNDETYILTLVSFSEIFPTYKPVFEKIAASFILN